MLPRENFFVAAAPDDQIAERRDAAGHLQSLEQRRAVRCSAGPGFDHPPRRPQPVGLHDVAEQRARVSEEQPGASTPASKPHPHPIDDQGQKG